MALNPCPCMPLQSGVRLLAIIDAVLSLLNLGLFLLVLLAILFYKGENEIEDGDKGVSVVIVVVAILIAGLQFLLALRLYRGAKEKDSRRCRSWLAATVVIITIYAISLVTNRTAKDFHGGGLAVFMVAIIYKVFEVVLVVAFIEMLKQDHQRGIGYIFPPVAAPQPHPLYPTSNVYTIDPPPSYFHIQNQTAHVEPPPPYCSESATVSQRDTANSGI
ncbi:hypothetical protein Ocin01_16743 [Orchesella cincta]|uniref:Uncharacterized protein n=1 Tax=Orchesella cincta TaxID=48709 RepID=A0A1D2MAB5_ORCCI|nr:hypothetical protein Ocin01_16743 [Orchesella cincta]